jgi:hypothetical protein
MLRRHGPPVPSETLLTERSVVRRLWRRKLRDGAEVTATLWWNNSIGAVVELEVHASFAEDTIAEGIAAGLLATLDADGAKDFEPEPGAVVEIVKELEE